MSISIYTLTISTLGSCGGHISYIKWCRNCIRSLFSSLMSSCSSLNLCEANIAQYPGTPHSVCMALTDSSLLSALQQQSTLPLGPDISSNYGEGYLHTSAATRGGCSFHTSMATRGKAASTLVQQLGGRCEIEVAIGVKVIHITSLVWPTNHTHFHYSQRHTEEC